MNPDSLSLKIKSALGAVSLPAAALVLTAGCSMEPTTGKAHMDDAATGQKAVERYREVFRDHAMRERLHPGSQKEQENQKKERETFMTLDRNDKAALIGAYITSGEESALDALLEGDDIAFVVDWKEYDDEIVEDCESVLKTGELSAEFSEEADEDNPLGYDVFIHYKGRRVRIPLSNIGVGNRDRTIHTLSALLAPEYTIRYAIEADTAILLPLETTLWNEIIERFGKEKVAKYFEPVMPDSVFWGED
jgi:hypothetical protein